MWSLLDFGGAGAGADKAANMSRVSFFGGAAGAGTGTAGGANGAGAEGAGADGAGNEAKSNRSAAGEGAGTMGTGAFGSPIRAGLLGGADAESLAWRLSALLLAASEGARTVATGFFTVLIAERI